MPMAKSAVLTVQPPSQLDPVATVVAVQFDSPPVIDPWATAIRADANGVITLKAADAVINGRRLKFDEEHEQLDAWTNAHDEARWDFVTARGGKYKVSMIYTFPDESAGSTFDVVIGESSLNGQTAASNEGGQTAEREIGTMSVGQGPQTLIVRPIKVNKGGLMQLKTVALTPAN